MFSLFSRRSRDTQESRHTSIIKIILSTLLTVGITSSILYATNITTVVTQTIADGDIMTTAWFQSVNNRILGNTPVVPTDLANKAYVDAAVSAAGGSGTAGGGSLKVYKSDGVTLLGNFLQKYEPYPSAAGNISIQYAGLGGSISNLTHLDMASITPSGQKIYFKTSDCSGQEYLAFDYNPATSGFDPTGPLTTYLGSTIFIYSLPNGTVYSSPGFGGYPPNTGANYYYAYSSVWDGISCQSGNGNITPLHASLGLPNTKIIKQCGFGDCKIKSDSTGGSSGGGGGCSIVGGSCGGGIFAGTQRGYSIIATPGGCTDSTTPTCDNYATDSVTKQWSTEYVTRGVTSTSNGAANTATLAALSNSSAYPAAKYCADMVYGGYSDWYLPSTDELNVLYKNSAFLGGFPVFQNGTAYFYWSSTESANLSYAFGQNMLDGGISMNYVPYQGYNSSKTGVSAVRCIRKY